MISCWPAKPASPRGPERGPRRSDTEKRLRPGRQPSTLIIGRLDRPSIWRGCDGHTHPPVPTPSSPRPAPAKGLTRDHGGGRLILTDPTVWTREARGALAAVPVVPVDAGSTVVAARGGKKKIIIKESLVFTAKYLHACYKQTHLSETQALFLTGQCK